MWKSAKHGSNSWLLSACAVIQHGCLLSQLDRLPMRPAGPASITKIIQNSFDLSVFQWESLFIAGGAAEMGGERESEEEGVTMWIEWAFCETHTFFSRSEGEPQADARLSPRRESWWPQHLPHSDRDKQQRYRRSSSARARSLGLYTEAHAARLQTIFFWNCFIFEMSNNKMNKRKDT